MYVSVSNGQFRVEVGGLSGGVVASESESWIRSAVAGLSAGQPGSGSVGIGGRVGCVFSESGDEAVRDFGGWKIARGGCVCGEFGRGSGVAGDGGHGSVVVAAVVEDGAGDEGSSVSGGGLCVGADGVVEDKAACGLGKGTPGEVLGGQSECGQSSKVAEVSERTLRNRQKRAAKKARKLLKQEESSSRRLESGGCSMLKSGPPDGGLVPEWRRGTGRPTGFFSEASEETRRRLRGTRAARLAAENELAAFKATRQLELEKAKDFVQMKKSQETRLLRDTERNKVQIEKAFLSLAKAGNVPGIGGSVSGGGSVKTVVSGSSSSNLASGTISPNSSVSMKEVHEMQKAFESLKLEHAQCLAEMKKAGVKMPEEKSPSMSTGWTTDGNGYFAAHHLAEGYDHLPEAYMVCRDGRIHSNYFGEHDFDHHGGE